MVVMDFSGSHVAITGASSGIGLATARLVAARGGKVSLVARRVAELERIAGEIGPGARAVPADVGDKEQLLEALDLAVAANGPIDSLFLNAGMGGGFVGVADYSDEQFEAVMRVNALAAFWAIRHVAPAMTARGSGAILVTGSLASERGMANNIGYVASKHAVLGIARAAAIELAPGGVRVNCLIPGFIDTPMMAEVPNTARAHLAARIPQGRLGASEEMAQTAAFLLSDAASHITGQALSVDGGVLGTLQV